jgi:hypothetical protein
MRVELTCDRAGALGVIKAGAILDIPADEAKRLIEARQAIPAMPEVEAAVIDKRETRGGRHRVAAGAMQ